MPQRNQINFRTDPEIDGMIEDLKQDIFNKTNIDMNTTQLFYKLIADAWDKCDTKLTSVDWKKVDFKCSNKTTGQN